VFGTYQALKPVSFDIYDNEFFTLPARAAAMAMPSSRILRRILNSAAVSDKLAFGNVPVAVRGLAPRTSGALYLTF